MSYCSYPSASLAPASHANQQFFWIFRPSTLFMNGPGGRLFSSVTEFLIENPLKNKRKKKKPVLHQSELGEKKRVK